MDAPVIQGLSEFDQVDGWVKGAKIAGVGRDDALLAAAGADEDVGVSDVGCSAGSKQPSYIRRIHPVERDDVGGRLADQPCQPGLLFWSADRLGERRGRDSDAGT